MQSNDLDRLHDIVRTLEFHEDVEFVEVTRVDVDEYRIELAVDLIEDATAVADPADLTELMPDGPAASEPDTTSTTHPGDFTGGGGTVDQPAASQTTDEDSDTGPDSDDITDDDSDTEPDNDDTTDEFDDADTAVRDALEDNDELTHNDLAQITGVGDQLLYEVLRQDDIDRRRDPEDKRRKLYSLPTTDVEGNGGAESTVTTFEEVETPDWLTESSWHTALDMSDDLDELVETLGWKDPDAVETTLQALGQTDEVTGVSADG